MTEGQNRTYKIRIQGHLDPQRSVWFGGLEVTHLPGGETLLRGEIADQSALNAILNRIHSMNIKLISVEPVDQQSGDHPS